MKVLVTGYNGFIGKNLVAKLSENPEIEIFTFGSNDSIEHLSDQINEAEFIFHLAGVNRPQNETAFAEVNRGLTKILCDLAAASGKIIPIVFTSSVHVERDNAYGRSKLDAEEILKIYANKTGSSVYIYRLPHVIGKWCKPNYNSVVATFCHNIARDLPVTISDPNFEIKIIYIDDLLSNFNELLYKKTKFAGLCNVDPTYKISLGKLVEQLMAFKKCRTDLVIENVGIGLVRALYATYMSYMENQKFDYKLKRYSDSRGTFVEVLKTKESGQFSYFTAHPGITRGGHYHHTKTEKFIVIKGTARFRFEHLITGEFYDLITSDDESIIVETIPGWIHDITNIGKDEMIVMLWANEIFNPEQPDTIMKKINHL
jgi:UDP-2-acetamido-2,6-beta-L-arabino-hexul-4-ose reductase